MMRRLAALVRDDVILTTHIDRELERGGTAAETPAIVAGGGLSALVEHHLAAYFAEFGSALPPDGLHDRVLADVERPLLMTTMAAVRGNQLRAARLLGINRNTLRKRLADLGIDPATGRNASR
jgi:two-component system nitrogen regulation response regulator GlnG